MTSSPIASVSQHRHTAFYLLRSRTAQAAQIVLLTISCWAVVVLCAGLAVPQTKPPAKHQKIESKHKLSQGLLREPPMPEKCAKQQGTLINMLVMGDSIMWGQGLKEENKISFLVQKWLCTDRHRPVRVWREAHSGAVLKVGEPTPDVPNVPGATSKSTESKEEFSEAGAIRALAANELSSATKRLGELSGPKAAVQLAEELGGEVNVDRPTIPEQLEHALTRFKGPEVDFVLMDGCANDFSFAHFITASMTQEQIHWRANAVCYERMKPVLKDVADRFPNARIVVTGYYPIITGESSKNVLLRFVLGWVLPKEKQKWLFPNAKKLLFQRLVLVSKQWADASNAALRRSVTEANGKANNRIAFAPAYYKPASGFGSVGSGFAAPKKTSLLWTSLFNSTGRAGLSKFFYVIFALNFHPLRPNDEVYFSRKSSCKDAKLEGFVEGKKCQLAAWGHPNKKGVSEYVESVTRELRRMIDTTDWLPVGSAIH